MPAIALCLIARNEEALLGGCLDSVRGVVDRIALVDTGSNDRTVEIAERAGAKVLREPWRDDFAHARNASLALAGADWALVLDADERLALPVGGPAAARAQLERFACEHPRALGRVLVRNVDGDRELSRIAITRFLPLRAGAQFVGRIHEQAQTDDGARAPRVDTGLVVEHLGYAAPLMRERDKLARNLALLERWSREAPDDGYAWYQLGRTRADAGQRELALEALERALERSHDNDPWAVHAVEIGARVLHSLGRTTQAFELAQRASALAPRRADTLFLSSSLALDLGDVEAARRGFLACLEACESDSPIESWRGASSYAAAHNLGVIAECSAQPTDARAWYRRALEFEPGHAPSLAGLARLEAERAGLSSAAPMR